MGKEKKASPGKRTNPITRKDGIVIIGEQPSKSGNNNSKKKEQPQKEGNQMENIAKFILATASPVKPKTVEENKQTEKSKGEDITLVAEDIVKIEVVPKDATKTNPSGKKKKIFKGKEKAVKSYPPHPQVSNNKAGPSRSPALKKAFTIKKLYHEMRENTLMSDRWCIPEPMWDPHYNSDVLLCYEVDVLMDGSVRMKRCLKILENFELVVLLDGADKTHLFRDKHPFVRSSSELLDLIRRVTMVKVCSGIKDCDPTEFDNFASRVKERGGSWFSLECNVEVERGCLGNICKKCTSLRNTLRRKMKRQYGLDSSTSGQTPQGSSRAVVNSNSVRPVMRQVGEALYSNLNHMALFHRIGEDVYDDDEDSSRQRSSEQVFHPEMKIYMNKDLKERLDDLQANPPPPLTKVEHVIEFDQRTMTRTVRKVQTPILPTSFRNLFPRSKKKVEEQQPQQTYVMGSNGELTLVQTANGETIQLPEGFILADESNWSAAGDNVIVQKIEGQEDQFIVNEDNGNIVVGSNFTLEDGEEYEIIGEAPAGASVEGGESGIQVLGNNSDIEIIEVDENMIQLVDENSQPPEIQPVDASSDIFKFLQAQSRLHV